jgi:hypothetical protein
MFQSEASVAEAPTQIALNDLLALPASGLPHITILEASSVPLSTTEELALGVPATQSLAQQINHFDLCGEQARRPWGKGRERCLIFKCTRRPTENGWHVR